MGDAAMSRAVQYVSSRGTADLQPSAMSMVGRCFWV
jgi:hypothetical protein